MNTRDENHMRFVLNHPCGNIGVIPPDGEATLLRYMDLQKFESLLVEKSLYLRRADKFDDQFEGSFPQKAFSKYIENQIELNHSLVQSGILSSAEVNHPSLFQKLQEKTFVNCWCMNEHESEGLWMRYGKSSEAVAVKTTGLKLLRSIKQEHSIFIGKVFYCDFEEDEGFPLPAFPSPIEPWFYKRKQYEDEREVRVVVQKQNEGSRAKKYLDVFSRNLPVDIKILIQNVIVSPFSEPSFKDKICELMSRHSLAKELVVDSRMRGIPLVP